MAEFFLFWPNYMEFGIFCTHLADRRLILIVTYSFISVQSLLQWFRASAFGCTEVHYGHSQRLYCPLSAVVLLL